MMERVEAAGEEAEDVRVRVRLVCTALYLCADSHTHIFIYI